MPQPPPPSRRRSAHPHPAQATSAQHGDCDTDQPCLLERAQLHAVPSTLLIPLAARAHGGRYFAWLACHDAVATQLLAEPGGRHQCVSGRPAHGAQRAVAHAGDQAGGARVFAEHPQALGVNLGCGLTHHFQWLDTGANQWLDADLPG